MPVWGNSQFLQNYLGKSSIIVDDSIEIPGGIIVPETESQDGFEFGLNGLLVSNFGTQLGWPDLFSPDTRRPGIGKFGLMDVGLLFLVPGPEYMPVGRHPSISIMRQMMNLLYTSLCPDNPSGCIEFLLTRMNIF